MSLQSAQLPTPDRQTNGASGLQAWNSSDQQRRRDWNWSSRTSTVSDETPTRHSLITACPPPPDSLEEDDDYYTAPPPDSPSEASASSSPAGPPPFSSLFFAPSEFNHPKATGSSSASPPAFASSPSVEEPLDPAPSSSVVADTKTSLSETRAEGLGKNTDDGEPPPPYTEGYSPLESFTYVMAAAGGASSIITQVQQTGGPPINTLGGIDMNNIAEECAELVMLMLLFADIGGDEHITLDLR